MIADFLRKTGDTTDEDVQNLVKETALKETDIRLWVDHLNHIQTRRAAEKGSRKETTSKITFAELIFNSSFHMVIFPSEGISHYDVSEPFIGIAVGNQTQEQDVHCVRKEPEEERYLVY